MPARLARDGTRWCATCDTVIGNGNYCAPCAQYRKRLAEHDSRHRHAVPADRVAVPRRAYVDLDASLAALSGEVALALGMFEAGTLSTKRTQQLLQACLRVVAAYGRMSEPDD